MSSISRRGFIVRLAGLSGLACITPKLKAETTLSAEYQPFNNWVRNQIDKLVADTGLEVHYEYIGDGSEGFCALLSWQERRYSIVINPDYLGCIASNVPGEWSPRGNIFADGDKTVATWNRIKIDILADIVRVKERILHEIPKE